jgi:hypothetical protein
VHVCVCVSMSQCQCVIKYFVCLRVYLCVIARAVSAASSLLSAWVDVRYHVVVFVFVSLCVSYVCLFMRALCSGTLGHEIENAQSNFTCSKVGSLSSQ